MNRQSWTIEEDEAISRLVAQHGFNDWTQIAVKLKEVYNITKRTGKQCRERWYNHLNPAVNKKPWDNQEEEQLFELHKSYGNKWKDISRHFTGRTDNDIKNHFYSTLRRSLRRLNKILGEKNSTSQMRQIKPSVLSTIMNYLYQQQHGLENDFYRSLRDLPSLIFEFANFKPIKTNLKFAKVEDAKTKISEIFELINRFNDDYETNKLLRQNTKQLIRSSSKKQQNNNTLPITSSSLSPPLATFTTSCLAQTQVKVQQQSNQANIYHQLKHTSQQLHESGELFEADKILQQQHQSPLLQKQQEGAIKLQIIQMPSRNISLDDDQMEEEMKDIQEPSLISRMGEQIDLTVFGKHWEPPSWEKEAEIVGFVDQVLLIDYDQL